MASPVPHTLSAHYGQEREENRMSCRTKIVLIIIISFSWVFFLFCLSPIAYSQSYKVEELIHKLLMSPDPSVREGSAKVLGEMKDPQAVKPLITGLVFEEDGKVRSAILVALIKIGNPAVEQLIYALEYKNNPSVVRQDAAEALGVIGDPRAVDPLIVALKDGHPMVRYAAATSLMLMKNRHAVDPLIDALTDKYSFVRERAQLALKVITGEDFGQDPEKWKTWWKQKK